MAKPLLTASDDELLVDELRGSGMADNDPLSKAASNRIRIYDDSLGFAVHPEEKSAILDYKGKVNAQTAKLQKEKAAYQQRYGEAMSEADKKAQGLLASIKDPSGTPPRTQKQEKIAVRVIGDSGVQGTYLVNREAFEKGKSEYFKPNGQGGYDINVNIEGRVRGQEIHDALRQAAQETAEADKLYAKANQGAMSAYNTQMSAAEKATALARSATEQSITSQKGVAEKQNAQNLEMYNAAIKQNQSYYNNYINNMRKAFSQGVQNNDAGIRKLLESGVLTLKG